MTDEPQPVTILKRMVAAGIPEDRARQHLANGGVSVDGEPVHDPETPAPGKTSWSIGPR